MSLEYQNIITLIKRAISVLIYYPIAAIFKTLSIKTPHFYVDRIGHLVVDPESFLKDYYLLNGRFPRCLLIASKSLDGLPINQTILNYWKKYFIVIQNPILVRIFLPLCFHPLLRSEEKYAATQFDTAITFDINNKWGERDPLLKITVEDFKAGHNILMQMGLQENDWFVCVHARESGFDKQCDGHKAEHRNANIETFIPSIQYIINQGGKCIRMGDSSMSPCPKIDGLIDYAIGPYKSDFMDVFLCSESLFFLGSNSGIFEMSTVFGTPVAISNMSPLTSVPRGRHDLSIPMMHSKSGQNDLLSFSEIMNSDIANYRDADAFKKAGIILVPNSKEEILELATEQFQKVTNSFIQDKDNRLLQKKYKNLFKPGHYGFGYASQIGEKFLKRYSDLLP
jgi:putative glycosyltransferase (TIGR04372 family)